MMSIRTATPQASRHRCRRRSGSGPAYYLSLAGFLAVALAATAASHPRMHLSHPASAMADVLSTQPRTADMAPESVETARIGSPEASGREDDLTRLVARRYRVANGPAGEVVGAVLKEARTHGIDPLLVLAVIAVESRFNPVAESAQGALGLMQVVPRFHMDKIAALGVTALLRPEANIAIGVKILKDSMRKGGEDVAAGLQFYNGAVDDDTRAYATRVLNEQKRIENALPKSRERAA